MVKTLIRIFKRKNYILILFVHNLLILYKLRGFKSVAFRRLTIHYLLILALSPNKRLDFYYIEMCIALGFLGSKPKILGTLYTLLYE